MRVLFKPVPGSPEAGDLGFTWLSETEGLVMIDDNPSEGWTWEITAIQLREPDPGTFDIPADFNEMREPNEVPPKTPC